MTRSSNSISAAEAAGTSKQLGKDRKMPGKIILAVGQLGPIARSDSREKVVARLVDMLEQAAARNSDFIVFPELALTTFFPRWYFTDQAELDAFYETDMP